MLEALVFADPPRGGDGLLAVADETRLGALRLGWIGEKIFRTPIRKGIPALIELGRLLQITGRILRDKETDEYSVETWEEIALRLANQAGVATPQHQLIEVAGKAVMLPRRFDRKGAIRIPFLSAMAMMGARDGERGSYPEIIDAHAQHGARGRADAHAAYRRVVFDVLIANVDDHLRNHGFLWLGNAGGSPSPACDLNPIPADLKARVPTTNINLDKGACSLDLLESASEFFSFTQAQARAIIQEVAAVTVTWRDCAASVGVRWAEVERMAGAFEHDDLQRALPL